MNDWFTVDQIDDRTYAISEYGHFLEPHCYLFIGETKAALVDSGLGIGDIRQIIAQLTDKPVLVILTHGHIDHFNGNKDFSEVAVHQEDAYWLEHFPRTKTQVRENTFRKPFRKTPPTGFVIDQYEAYQEKPTQLLQDGDIVDLGKRQLRIIHTPGHSPGHICVYEPATGYLATGDLLYRGRINASFPSTDPVRLYQSLKKLAQLPKITKIFPGHHTLHISTDYLQEAIWLLEKIRSKGELKHGSGLHQSQNLSILL